MKRLLLAVIFSFYAVQASPAADWSEPFQYGQPGNKFAPNEFLVDVFGVVASRDRDDFEDTTFGLGAGVNYFFSDYFGVGAETYLDDFDWLTHIDVSFLARYPLEDLSLAPYGFAGFGRQFNNVSQWTGHIGIGAEFRMNKAFGFFTDLRQVFADRTKDFTVWRFGVRIKL